MPVVAEDAQSVVGQDGALEGPVSGTKRSKAIGLLHIFRNFQPAQALDLPLWGPGPDRIRSPYDMIGAEPLDKRAHQGCGEARLRNAGIGEQLPKVGIHVADTILCRNLRQVADPGAAAGGIPFLHRNAWVAADMP